MLILGEIKDLSTEGIELGVRETMISCNGSQLRGLDKTGSRSKESLTITIALIATVRNNQRLAVTNLVHTKLLLLLPVVCRVLRVLGSCAILLRSLHAKIVGRLSVVR